MKLRNRFQCQIKTGVIIQGKVLSTDTRLAEERKKESESNEDEVSAKVGLDPAKFGN